MRLSHILFILSSVSWFGILWVMFLQIVPRDGFGYGFAVFAFLFMMLSGAVSTIKDGK